MVRRTLPVLASAIAFLLVVCSLLVCEAKHIGDGSEQSRQRANGSPGSVDSANGDDRTAGPTELAAYLEKLKSKDAKAVSEAFRALVKQQAAAIPVLRSGLADQETRLACVEILTHIPSKKAVSMLVEELRKAPEVSLRDRYYKRFVIGGLGRLKAQEGVPVLEALLQARRTQGGPTSEIAWALREITGKDYGPTWDPWSKCGE